jgi:nitronate monooxygenase
VGGRGLAIALALGCDGIVLGTRMWASEEALGNQNAKLQLASNESENSQVIRTNVIDQITNSCSSVPWPFPFEFDSVGALRNPTIETWHGKEQELDAALKEKNSSLAAE